MITPEEAVKLDTNDLAEVDALIEVIARQLETGERSIHFECAPKIAEVVLARYQEAWHCQGNYFCVTQTGTRTKPRDIPYDIHFSPRDNVLASASVLTPQQADVMTANDIEVLKLFEKEFDEKLKLGYRKLGIKCTPKMYNRVVALYDKIWTVTDANGTGGYYSEEDFGSNWLLFSTPVNPVV